MKWLSVAVLCLFFSVYLAGATFDLTAEVNNGFFEGRSGDFVAKPQTSERTSPFMVFLPSAEVVVPTEEHEMTETQVADLLYYLVGTVAPFNPNVDRTNFPKKSFFNNPKANVMFVVDSTPTKAGLPSIASLPKQKIVTEAYPDNSLTSLTSMLTGTTPSQHGIINDVWFNEATAAAVSAYDSWCPGKTGSAAASFQDVTGIAFGGQSLSLSFSSKLSFARATATKPRFLKDTSRNYALYWNGKSFGSVYEDRTDSILGGIVSLNLARSHGGLFSFNKEDNTVQVTVKGQTNIFNLNVKEDAAFVAEIAFALGLVYHLEHNAVLNDLVNDKIPDFYTFAFSSLKDLKAKYGADSARVQIAFSLLDHTISKVCETLGKLYHHKLLAEAVFLGSEEQADKKVILEKIQSTLLSQLADQQHVAQYYPHIYLDPGLDEAQKKRLLFFAARSACSLEC